MATDLITDPNRLNALRSCVRPLQRLASYELEPSFDRRMHELGERKEFLNSDEHDELLALVAFVQQRTLEKLEAEVALKHLQEVFPDLVDAA